MHGAVIEREDPLHSYLGIIKRTSATRAFAPGEVNLQLYVRIFRHVFMKCKDPPLYWLGSSCLLVQESPFLTQESSEARQDQSAHYRLPRANARQLVQSCLSLIRLENCNSNNQRDHAPPSPMPNRIITAPTCSAHYNVSRLNIPLLGPIGQLVLTVFGSVRITERLTPRCESPCIELDCTNAGFTERGLVIAMWKRLTWETTSSTFLLMSRPSHAQPNIIILVDCPSEKGVAPGPITQFLGRSC